MREPTSHAVAVFAALAHGSHSGDLRKISRQLNVPFALAKRASVELESEFGLIVARPKGTAGLNVRLNLSDAGFQFAKEMGLTCRT